MIRCLTLITSLSLARSTTDSSAPFSSTSTMTLWSMPSAKVTQPLPFYTSHTILCVNISCMKYTSQNRQRIFEIQVNLILYFGAEVLRCNWSWKFQLFVWTWQCEVPYQFISIHLLKVHSYFLTCTDELKLIEINWYGTLHCRHKKPYLKAVVVFSTYYFIITMCSTGKIDHSYLILSNFT